MSRGAVRERYWDRMHQSERVTSTSGGQEGEESDLDIDSWPGDSTSPTDSEEKECEEEKQTIFFTQIFTRILTTMTAK